MELYPKRKSDAEYIAMIREHVGRGKRHAVFFGFMFLVFMGLYLAFNYVVFRFHEIMPEAADALPLGVLIGVKFGVVMVFLGGLAAFCAITAMRHVSGNRTAVLMLRFHDELKQRESSPRDRHAPSEAPLPRR